LTSQSDAITDVAIIILTFMSYVYKRPEKDHAAG